jgi:hypothetical protein
MEQLGIKEPVNPGSYNEFCERSGLVGESAVNQYAIELDEFRLALASFKGISLEDLHDMKSR